MSSTTLSMIMWIFAALVLIGLITRRRRRKMRDF
jgi:MYXO-CTERM domain-containing protein